MQKTILFLTLITVSTITWAQKFKSSTDKFTGKTTYYTEFETIYSHLAGYNEPSNKLSFSIFKINDSLFICIDLRLGGYKSLLVSEGQNLILKPSGKDVLKLPAPIQTQADLSSSMNATTLTQMYYLDQSNFSILKTCKIEAVRIEHSSGNLDFDIKEKNSLLFSKTLNK